jgi:hypothetical protein
LKRLEKTHEGIDVGKNFLNKTLIAQEIIARIDKWDHITLKSFCTGKETMTSGKKCPTEWENIFGRYPIIQQLISSPE